MIEGGAHAILVDNRPFNFYMQENRYTDVEELYWGISEMAKATQIGLHCICVSNFSQSSNESQRRERALYSRILYVTPFDFFVFRF